jgi:hypothetical protein
MLLSWFVCVDLGLLPPYYPEPFMIMFEYSEETDGEHTVVIDYLYWDTLNIQRVLTITIM